MIQQQNTPPLAGESCQPETSRALELGASTGSAPSVRFRLLVQWEKIEEGDEMLDEDCQTWTRVPLGNGKTAGERWMIGCRWNSASLVPFRRAVPNNRIDLTEK